MRKCLLLTIALCWISSSLGWSQQLWKESDRKDVEVLWDQYNRAFIEKDFKQLRQILQLPFLRINDRETLTMNTMDEAIESYRRTRDALDARGYKTSRFNFADARISVLSATRIFVNIPFSRYKVDGSLLERSAGFYLMSKTSGQWKICSVILQDPTEMGKLH